MCINKTRLVISPVPPVYSLSNARVYRFFKGNIYVALARREGLIKLRLARLSDDKLWGFSKEIINIGCSEANSK